MVVDVVFCIECEVATDVTRRQVEGPQRGETEIIARDRSSITNSCRNAVLRSAVRIKSKLCSCNIFVQSDRVVVDISAGKT